jgi:hypothetical protein
LKKEEDESSLIGDQVTLLHRKLQAASSESALQFEKEVQKLMMTYKKWLVKNY